MSIRLRLAALFTLVTIGLLVGGGVLFVQRLRTGLEDSLDLSLRTRADGLISTVGAGNFQDNNPSQLVSAGGSYVQLLTTQGRLIESSDGLPRQPLLTAAQAASAARQSLVTDTSITLNAPGEAGTEGMRLLAVASEQPGVVLVVVTNRDVVDQAVSQARKQLVILSVIVLLVIGPGSWLLTRAALRPVERMRRQVAELHARDAAHGVPVPRTRDEISRLAETFNGLLGRLHAVLTRERAFVADAGHELRTPLSVLKGELELARRAGRSRTELAQTVEVAAEETERLVRLAEDLLVLASDTESGPVPSQHFDLAALTSAAIDSWASSAGQRGVVFSLQAPRSLDAVGDPNRIRQAIDNLLSNALRHAPDATTITITVTRADRQTQLIVSDNGPGFPSEFLPVAFDRFTRADGARSRLGAGDEPGGNGLGLAIVRSIMSRHGGTASAENNPDGGARLTLRWPAP